MKTANQAHEKDNRRIKIEQPLVQSPDEDRLWQEVRKYEGLVPFAPEPNMGRLAEIKEEIEKGTYLTPEVIEETAARLAIRFMKRE